MKHGNVFCHGCSVKCEILPEQEFRASQCLNTRVCIWPEVNVFFDVGVRSVINSIGIITSSAGFVLWTFPGEIFGFLCVMSGLNTWLVRI